jgi:predicted anti-sigma-YlaC factor YlaD
MTGCHIWREYVSADLDGELDSLAVAPVRPGVPPARGLASAYEHLAGCAECARWFAQVTRANRLLRTAHAEPAPGMDEAALARVLDQLPDPPSERTGRRRLLGRIGLAVVGTAQLLLGGLPLVLPSGGGGAGMSGMGGMTGMAMAHLGMMGAGMAHMTHEYSAWNLAIGVAFLAGAAWTRHLAGMLPVLVSFVAVLLVVSAVDLADGAVDLARVGSHVLVVLGLALVVLVVRTGTPSPGHGPLGRRRVTPWTHAPAGPVQPPAPTHGSTRPNPAAQADRRAA